MIQVESLRVGNKLCHIHKGIITVKDINKREEGFYSTVNGLILDNCNPIPLTEGILEKCGFENVKSKDRIYRTGNEVYQIYYGEENCIFYREYNPNEYCYLRGDLRYLHELQNLYYSLTGKDLEIEF